MKARALYALAGTARRENGLDEALSLMAALSRSTAR